MKKSDEYLASYQAVSEWKALHTIIIHSSIKYTFIKILLAERQCEKWSENWKLRTKDVIFFYPAFFF